MATAEKPSEGTWTSKVADSMKKAVGMSAKESADPASGACGLWKPNAGNDGAMGLCCPRGHWLLLAGE